MNKKKAVILFIIIIIMISIFGFSSHTGTESSQISIKVTRVICRVIFRGYGNMDLAHQQFVVNELHHFVRKLAHFSIYAALGFFVYSFMEMNSMKFKRKFPLSWLICAVYAALDEFHQSFTPGRSMQFRDVMIDSAGAFCGIIAAIVVFAVIMYIRSEIADKNTDQSAS